MIVIAGGSQEDDRTGGYQHAVGEFLAYSSRNQLSTKILFINDGPGLLLGSMWRDYGALEYLDEHKVMVVTPLMFSERVTAQWLRSK